MGAFRISGPTCVAAAVFAVAAGVAAAGNSNPEEWSPRLAVVSGEPPSQAAARREPFRAALGEALRAEAEILVLKDAASQVEAIASGRANYAAMSATAFALAQELCACLEALAVARASGGETAFREVLVARGDGPADIASLKGKRIAAARAGGFGGLDVAMAALTEAGVVEAPGAATILLVPSSEAAFARLASGEADAAVSWMPASAGSAGEGTKPALAGAIPGLRVIWRSVEIPHRLHAVRKDAPDAMKRRLREFLTGLYSAVPGAYDAIEPDFGGGFVAARQGQVEPLIGIVRALRGADGR
jgi:phosphonate transport system substrate-binding protein